MVPPNPLSRRPTRWSASFRPAYRVLFIPRISISPCPCQSMYSSKPSSAHFRGKMTGNEPTMSQCLISGPDATKSRMTNRHPRYSTGMDGIKYLEDLHMTEHRQPRQPRPWSMCRSCFVCRTIPTRRTITRLIGKRRSAQEGADQDRFTLSAQSTASATSPRP